jgi:hypothetical protein
MATEPPVEPERDGQPESGDARSPDAVWTIPAGGFDTYRQAAVHLRRPFTPEAVRFKLQSTFGPKANPKGGLIVAYIDARLVIERFNLVCPHLWSPGYELLPGGKLLLCRLTVDGITREDVGESVKGLSKDIYSDALKRAAVHFGVGVSLYAVPQIRLFESAIKAGNLERRGEGEKKTLVITEKGDGNLRKGYGQWLREHGEPKFGPALDHGDIEGVLEPTVDAEAEQEAVEAAEEAERHAEEFREKVKAEAVAA